MNRAAFLFAYSFCDLESYLEACKAQPYFGSKSEHEREARATWAIHRTRTGDGHGILNDGIEVIG